MVRFRNPDDGEVVIDDLVRGRVVVKNSELQVIMAAIQSTASRMEAAAKLGISPRTLRYKLAQFRQRGLSEGVSA